MDSVTSPDTPLFGSGGLEVLGHLGEQGRSLGPPHRRHVGRVEDAVDAVEGVGQSGAGAEVDPLGPADDDDVVPPVSGSPNDVSSDDAGAAGHRELHGRASFRSPW